MGKDEFKNDFIEEEKEIIGFDDETKGNELVSFNFGNDDLCCDEMNGASQELLQNFKNNKRLIPLSKIHKTKFLSSSGLTKNENGAAHIIDGEAPDSKRCYNLRSSTVRKLSELKSIHPDINICVSTIVDLAVNYFYSCIKED
ncbi:hypothetical protein [Clostridium sp. YIM B02555]|uniref:hypothetical protein n=1 Tax=Clostridium sp. YIM B02555 TaxID=2911968 RepID=UPI001EED69F5|nr:hypothetical protein [Clostridium sp. YIM B02555]